MLTTAGKLSKQLRRKDEMCSREKISLILRHLIASGVIIITFCNKADSQSFHKTDSIFSFRSQKGYFPSLLHNFGEQATSPLHFTTGEWVITGAAIGITGALFYFDNDINGLARVQKQNHNWVSKSSPLITELGSSWGICSVVAFGALNASFKNKKGAQTTLLATQAMITSSFWLHLVKQVTGRERPDTDYYYTGRGGGKLYGPFAQFDRNLAIEKPKASFNSFPSGHTATAFSIATVFASQYRDKKAIPVISYSLATLVGISRLTENKHWSSDVFVGALIGYVCGKQVVNHFNRTHQTAVVRSSLSARNKTELTLFQYENQVGIFVSW